MHKFYGTKWPLCADVPLSIHSFITLLFKSMGMAENKAAVQNPMNPPIPLIDVTIPEIMINM